MHTEEKRWLIGVPSSSTCSGVTFLYFITFFTYIYKYAPPPPMEGPCEARVVQLYSNNSYHMPLITAIMTILKNGTAGGCGSGWWPIISLGALLSQPRTRNNGRRAWLGLSDKTTKTRGGWAKKAFYLESAPKSFRGIFGRKNQNFSRISQRLLMPLLLDQTYLLPDGQ